MRMSHVNSRCCVNSQDNERLMDDLRIKHQKNSVSVMSHNYNKASEKKEVLTDDKVRSTIPT